MNKITQFQTKPERLMKKTYLKFIRNSVDSKTFRNFYLTHNGQNLDATKDGKLSCAFYVSSVLVIFQLIKRIHGTVKATTKDLEESGWTKTDELKSGNIIIWNAIQEGEDVNEHMGFYIGRGKAVSNSSKHRKIVMHDWTYNNTREIIAIYENPFLNK